MKRRVLAVLIGAVCGSAVIVLLMLLFSLLIVKSGSLNAALLLPVCLLAMTAGMFTGGFITARISGSMGMLLGAAAGTVGFLLLLAVNALSGAAPEVISLLRLAVMLFSGAVGGVIGINGKQKRRRRRRSG